MLEEMIKKTDATDQSDFIDFVYITAIFELQSQGLDGVLKIYQSLLSNEAITCNKTLHELLTQDFLLLYKKIVDNETYRPADFRAIIEASLKIYPTNTKIWDIFAWNEDKLKVENHLRRTFDTVIDRYTFLKHGFCGSLVSLSKRNESTLELWTWMIWKEYYQKPNYRSIHILTNLLEKCIEDPKMKCVGGIWRLYIDHLVEKGDLAKAKTIFYQGIRENAWNKLLYLRVFQSDMSSVFDDDEYEEILNLMEEKEIRLRQDIPQPETLRIEAE